MSFSGALHMNPYEYLCMPSISCLIVSVAYIEQSEQVTLAGMSKFMNQSPRHVARFVSECMPLRETKPDLSRHFEDYCHFDMFSSDGDG